LVYDAGGSDVPVTNRRSYPQKNALTSILATCDAFVYFDPAAKVQPPDLEQRIGTRVLRVIHDRKRPQTSNKFRVLATITSLRNKEALTGYLYVNSKVIAFTIPWSAVWGVRPAMYGSRGQVWPSQAPMDLMTGNTPEEIWGTVERAMREMVPPGDPTPPGLVVFNSDVESTPTPPGTLVALPKLTGS
jgi:hypothetical protein